MSEERERIIRETITAALPAEQRHAPTPDELAEADQQVKERAARILRQRQEAAQPPSAAAKPPSKQ